MNKIIIGLIGRPGVGKDTVVALMQEITDKKIEKFSFSRILIDEYCAHLGIEPTHPNLQYIGDAIRPEWLHARAKEYIEASNADIIIIPSIRRSADFAFVQSFPHHRLIGVEADEKVAYERMKMRKEKPGEEHLTWDAYQTLRNAPIDQEVGDLLGKAEVTLQNSGTLEDLKESVQKIMSDV